VRATGRCSGLLLGHRGRGPAPDERPPPALSGRHPPRGSPARRRPGARPGGRGYSCPPRQSSLPCRLWGVGRAGQPRQMEGGDGGRESCQGEGEVSGGGECREGGEGRSSQRGERPRERRGSGPSGGGGVPPSAAPVRLSPGCVGGGAHPCSLALALEMKRLNGDAGVVEELGQAWWVRVGGEGARRPHGVLLRPSTPACGSMCRVQASCATA
jgi:hypothetical protein